MGWNKKAQQQETSPFAKQGVTALSVLLKKESKGTLLPRGFNNLIAQRPAADQSKTKRAPQIESKKCNHRKDFSALLSISNSLAKREDIFEILFLVVGRLAQVLMVDRTSIVFSEDHAAHGLVVASSDDERMRNQPLDLNKYPELQQVLTSGKLLEIRDASQNDLLADVMRSGAPANFATMLLIPITGMSGTVAVLCLKRKLCDAFSDEEKVQAQLVANMTAIALNNAQTFGRLRDATSAHFSARKKDQAQVAYLSRFADFFESSRDPTLVLDHNGKIIFANAAAATLHNQSMDTLRGQALGSLFADSCQKLSEQLVKSFSKPLDSKGIDFTLRKSQPGERIVCAHFSRVKHEPKTVLTTMREVTAERALAQQLATARNFLERVIESTVNGIISADMNGKVLVFNEAAVQLLGYSKEEALSNLHSSQLYPRGMARDIMRLMRSRDQGEQGYIKDFRVDLLSKTGELIPVMLSASTLREGGKESGTVGTFTDIRDRLKIEKRLARAQEAIQNHEKSVVISEVAGAAAHELNQPLTAIMGYAEYLKRIDKGDLKQENAMRVILSEAERMANIIKKVGQLTRVKSMPYVGQSNIVDLERSGYACIVPADSNTEEQNDPLDRDHPEESFTSAIQLQVDAITADSKAVLSLTNEGALTAILNPALKK